MYSIHVYIATEIENVERKPDNYPPNAQRIEPNIWYNNILHIRTSFAVQYLNIW